MATKTSSSYIRLRKGQLTRWLGNPHQTQDEFPDAQFRLWVEKMVGQNCWDEKIFCTMQYIQTILYTNMYNIYVNIYMYTYTYLYYIYTCSICYTLYLLLQDPTLLMSFQNIEMVILTSFLSTGQNRRDAKHCAGVARLTDLFVTILYIYVYRGQYIYVYYIISQICTLRILMCSICLCCSNSWHVLLKIDGQWTNSDNFRYLPRAMWASMGVNHEPMPLLWTTSHFFNMSHWRLQDLQQQLSVLTEERDLARATWPSWNHGFVLLGHVMASHMLTRMAYLIIFINMFQQYHPNIGRCTIHGPFGYSRL